MISWFWRNLRTLFLAFIFAIAVWVSAVTAADPDEVRNFPRTIPLEIIGQDPSQIIIGNLPRQVTISLRAPRSVWDKLLATDESVRAVIDLSGLGIGEHNIPVQIQIQERPVRILSIVPGSIDLTLEPLATRTLPVDLVLVGKPAVGFQTGQAAVQPANVIISGPESLVERAKSVNATLNIAGQRDTLESSLRLQVLDEAGKTLTGLSLTPDNVNVNLPISQQGGYRDIAVKVVIRGQVAGGYRLTNISVYPPVVTVFSGDPALVNAMAGYVETTPLNLNGASQNIDTRLSLVLPDQVSLVGEQTVQVQVGIAAIEGSLALSNMKVEVIGLDDGLQATISPETVDVILSGPLPLLDKLTAGDVKIVVDLTGLAVGTHQVSPIAQILLNDIHIQAINPATIEVVIAPASTPTP